MNELPATSPEKVHSASAETPESWARIRIGVVDLPGTLQPLDLTPIKPRPRGIIDAFEIRVRLADL